MEERVGNKICLKLPSYCSPRSAEQELAPYKVVGCQGIIGPVPPPFLISFYKYGKNLGKNKDVGRVMSLITYFFFRLLDF